MSDIIYIAAKCSTSTTIDIILSEFLMFHQFFLSPQVKGNLIISNKSGIYELPNELPNDLRLWILGY